MKAISNPEHKALITALRQLEELQQSSLHNIDIPFPADGFLQHIQSLNERFSHYQNLLCQLAETIAEYEAMYKEIRTNVVAPALRQAKKMPIFHSTETDSSRLVRTCFGKTIEPGTNTSPRHMLKASQFS